MDVKVFKKVYKAGTLSAVNTEVLGFIRTQLYNAIDSEMTSAEPDSDKIQRFKTVWGTQGADSDAISGNPNNYGHDGYVGFESADQMYIPVTVTTVTDTAGNAIIFSQTKFKGQAKIITMG